MTGTTSKAEQGKDKSKVFMRLIDIRVFLNPEPREKDDLQTFLITFPLYVEQTRFLSMLQGRVEGETFPLLGKLGVCELLGEWVSVVKDPEALEMALRLLPQYLSTEDVNRVKLAIIRLHYGPRAPLRPIALRSFVSNDRVKMSGDQFMGATISQVAHAMTQHDFHMFTRVRSYGLLHKAWQGAERYELAPWLARLADRFQNVSGWVAATILQAEGLPQQAELLCSFIKLLKELVELRNHESALQILGGLNMACIQRLKHIWTLVPFKRRQEFDEVDELFSPVGNYAHYRELMTECELEDDVPCLPYLAVILRDIIYTFDGNPEFLTDGTLNEERLHLLSKHIRRVWRFQRTPFLLEPSSASLREIVRGMKCQLSEEELYQLSLDQQAPLAPLDDGDEDEDGHIDMKEILQEPLLCNGLRKFLGDREEGVLLHLIRDIDRLEELPPMPSVVVSRVQEIIQRYLLPDAQMRVPLEDETRRVLFAQLSEEESNRFLFHELREEVFHNLETNLLPCFLADPLYRSSRSLLKEIKEQHAYEAHSESPHAALLEGNGDITEEDWDALLVNVSQLLPVKKGEVLIAQDQTLDCLFRVQSGTFLVDSKATSGEVGRAVRVQPFAIFGEMNLFRPFPSASRIMAEQPGAVQRVDVCVLKKQLLGQPERALLYLRAMGKKLSNSLAKAAIYQRKAATEAAAPTGDPNAPPVPRGRKQEVQAKARLMITSREVTSRFAIPPQEELAAVYDCKISYGNVVSRPGMLYLTTRYLCYESKLLGRSSREAFPLARLESYEFVPGKYQLVIRAPDHKKRKFILDTRDLADCTVKLEELQKLPSRRRSMVPRRCRMRSLAVGEVDEMELLAEDWDLLMASQTRGIRFSPGDVIVEQDKPYCTVWQINTGSVRVEHQTTGEPLPLAKLGPGEIFGEVSFLTGWHATCSVIAESEVEVFVVTKAILHKMLEFDKSVVVKFYFYLCSVIAARLEAVHHPPAAPPGAGRGGGRTRSWHSVRSRPRDPVASV